MRCPYCQSPDTQVKDSRPAEDGSSIRRRRICPDCGGRFTTFERVQLRELMVTKKTGRKVPFDREKLHHSFEIALRKRPVIGLTILKDMKPDGKNKWEGTIYNADDGYTYSSVMKLSGDKMKVKGCVAFICKAMYFKRMN